MDVTEPDNPHAIRTATNRIVDPWHLTPDDIDINDIATALAHTNRFLGHTVVPFSVASHSIDVSWRLRDHGPSLQLAGLLHDASEAYLGDVPSPLKRRPEYAAYREAEHRATTAIVEWADISEWYDVDWVPEIHAADKASYEAERDRRFNRWVTSTSPDWVRRAFILRFNILRGEAGLA
jgi:hypothetical protein